MFNIKLKPMFKFLSFMLCISLFLACTNSIIQTENSLQNNKKKSTRIGLVIHAGAGTITRENLSSEKETAIRLKLSQALNAGYVVLDSGGTSIEAVKATILILEDSPLFNAGKGAVFTAEATHELDASIMDGQTLNAGAVSSVSTVKNPILLADKVMTDSRHVMLSGNGAERFSVQHGLEQVANSSFSTDFRFQQLQRALQREENKSEINSVPSLEFNGEEKHHDVSAHDPFQKFGTVGAVAIDNNGNLAAGTSTGGMTNKRYGRIGDSPIIGAGTYADNRSCAVSATGHGEYFIRYAVAHDICARVLHANKSLEQAANEVIMQDLFEAGGTGGIIAIDKDGNYTMPFNTKGMYRGVKFNNVEEKIEIYKDE